MKTDPIFYRLFKQQPSSFFELTGRSASEAQQYEFASVELKQTAFRIDGIFIPKAEYEELPLQFLEVFFYKEPRAYANLFAEIFLYLMQNYPGKTWRAVIIFGRRSFEPTELEPYEALLNSSQVQRIYLDELEAVPETSLGMQIVQLIIEKEESRAAEQARQLMALTRRQITDDAQRAEVVDLIETVVLYKFSNLTREEVQEMIGVNEFKQSRLYQDIKLEGKQEGLEEGEQRGRLLGKLEGKQEGKLELVPQLLARGFSIEEIAELMGLTVEQVRQAQQ